MAFSNAGLEAMHDHFCHILFIDIVTKTQAQGEGKGGKFAASWDLGIDGKLNNGPKDVCILESGNDTLYGQSNFADAIRDTEMEKLSWTSHMGLKQNHKSPWMREAEGDLTQRGGRRYDDGSKRSKEHKEEVISQEMQRTPETRKAKERDFPLRASRRKLPAYTLTSA